MIKLSPKRSPHRGLTCNEANEMKKLALSILIGSLLTQGAHASDVIDVLPIDSGMNVILCAAGVTTGGLSPKEVFTMKGCRDSIKKNCSMRKRKKTSPWRLHAEGGASLASCSVFQSFL